MKILGSSGGSWSTSSSFESPSILGYIENCKHSVREDFALLVFTFIERQRLGKDHMGAFFSLAHTPPFACACLNVIHSG